jgi:hypothetical protein
LELPRAAVLQADPEAVESLTSLVQRLFDRGPEVRCERQSKPAALRPEQVVVGVSHNEQKDFLRAALDRHGLGGVVVETANKLQVAREVPLEPGGGRGDAGARGPPTSLPPAGKGWPTSRPGDATHA